jgi:hypothetical protein
LVMETIMASKQCYLKEVAAKSKLVEDASNWYFL